MPRHITHQRGTLDRIANLNAYKLKPAARGSAAWNARATAVREIAPDILGVQEIVVDERTTAREDWESEAAALVHDFAAACGLSTAVTATATYPHNTAMANNTHRPWWTALMWNPDTVAVVDGSYRPYGAPDFWHGLTTVSFDIGARTPVLGYSYHGGPFHPRWRYDECLRIKGMLRRTGGVAPAVVLMDGDFVSATEVVGGRRAHALLRRRAVRGPGP
ncbi:hypothetical protein [Streptomyces pinistramenti]|uniref:hypothetical protein n=1 Tax=Streptomyces pinistramenti TaxID=2884812 RepID=UPI001D0726E5|nr:hypothetical protein [Streptomyces pinistramenti]MCB5908109.1 hypothetical protein [Streptomyces pinistramenti]